MSGSNSPSSSTESAIVRFTRVVLACFALLCSRLNAQSADTSRSRTFLNRGDLGWAAAATGTTVLISAFDKSIARASQESRFQDSSLHRFALNVSHVNETTLTIAGIATYGIGRLTHSELITDVALHATESVVLSSIAAQLIRGPLGRTRPYVSHDSDQYLFRPFKGFFGKSSFDNRAFPSIHTSSSMAVATVITMETNRRAPGATWIVAPVLYTAALLPGVARIQLDQHWASDIVSGAFMGVFAAYKVVSYSHDHPDNRFDRMFLRASVMPGPNGGVLVGFSPGF